MWSHAARERVHEGQKRGWALPAPRYELTETRNLSYRRKRLSGVFLIGGFLFSPRDTGCLTAKREEKEKKKLITLCTTPVDSGYSLIVT